MLLKEDWFEDYEEQADEYYDNGLARAEWEEVASKEVLDANGFTSEYTWYKNPETGEHKFFFDNEEDWEEDSEETAREWFDSYTGWEDVDEEEDTFIDSTLDEAVSGESDWDKLVKAFPELEEPIKEDVDADEVVEDEVQEEIVESTPATQTQMPQLDENKEFEVDDDISGITF